MLVHNKKVLVKEEIGKEESRLDDYAADLDLDQMAIDTPQPPVNMKPKRLKQIKEVVSQVPSTEQSVP